MKREEVLTVYEAIKFVDSRTAPIAELKEPVKTLEGQLNKNSIKCHYGTLCPYVNGGDVSRLLVEWDYLRQRLNEMEKVMALAQAEIEKLRQENHKLVKRNLNTLASLYSRGNTRGFMHSERH